MSLRVASCVGALIAVALSSVAAAKGTVTLDFAVNSEDKLLSLRLGSDGRIYALVDTASDARNCGLYALDESGSLITSFGQSGRVRLRNTCARDFAVRADHSIVTAVDRFASTGVNLVFLDANGKEVSVSATNRSVLSSHRIEAAAMILQPDNKIIVAGRSSFGGSVPDFNWEVLRWNADGSIDDDFLGIPLEILGGSAQSGADALALSSGKILVSGIGSSEGFQVKVRQLLESGDEDAAFGTEGVYAVPGTIAPETHARGGMAVDPANGKIYLLAGNQVDVVRLTASGAPDSTFSAQPTPAGRVPQSIVVDASGRAIVAGITNEAGGGLKVYLTRFTTAGAVDTAFGANGTGVVYAPLTRAVFQDLPGCKLAVQQSSGKLITACTVDNGADPQGYRVSDLTIARFNADGTLDATFGAAQKDSDIRPEAVTFNSTVARANTANVQSNAVTISGIDGRTTVRLHGASTSGSAFSIGCNGTFTDQPATISTGQTLCVRHHASPDAQGTVQTGVDLGGLYVTYTTQSTAEAADTTPDPFSFPAASDVTPGTSVYSEAITVTGFDGLAPISVENGDYLINCDRASSLNQPATIISGQTVCVRQTASSQPNTSVTTTLTIGGVSGTFTSTTTADGGSGNPLYGPTFQSQNGVSRSTVVTSNTSTVKGFGAPATVSISNGEYSIGCTQSFTSSPGTVTNGMQICVRHTSSPAFATTVRTEITLDSGTAQYTTWFTSTTVGGSFTETTTSSSGGGGALDYLFLAGLGALGALGRRVRKGATLQRSH